MWRAEVGEGDVFSLLQLLKFINTLLLFKEKGLKFTGEKSDADTHSRKRPKLKMSKKLELDQNLKFKGEMFIKYHSAQDVLFFSKCN